MELSESATQLAVMALAAAAAGGLLFALLMPLFTGSDKATKRVSAVSHGTSRGGGRDKVAEYKKEGRRKQIQETLKQFEEREKQRRRRMNMRMRIMQAGLSMSTRSFYLFSLLLGLVVALATVLVGVPLVVAIVAGFVGAIGLPRWLLAFLRKRRQEVFLNDFADAIDVMVRGLKAGLPINDAMRVIAAETGPPVGPEFIEVVEGQRVGITLQQGLERMYERMPLPEVNFLAIVMAIQAKTGGNLAEALNNLSKVLRDRKKMKQKIKAVSQEAKSSAAIIGALPFVITGGMTILNPQYLLPLWNTNTGNIMIAGSLIWMGAGILVMRKMINFNI